MMEQELIEIPFDEYLELKDDQMILQALYAAGVDNWEGYDEALASLEDE